MKNTIANYDRLILTDRIKSLKENMLNEPRYMSLEQARIITRSYRENAGDTKALKRAKSLAASLEEIEIKIDPLEPIVGNRTPGVRGGVVFPEAGSSWINGGIETLSTRPQDKFMVRPEDVAIFRNEIFPFWKGECLEDIINKKIGPEVSEIVKVAKINQKDHAQGHICPNTEKWLKKGPVGIRNEAEEKLKKASDEKRDFYKSVIIVQNGAISFIKRYAELALKMSRETTNKDVVENLEEVSRICTKLTCKPAESFHEALQSFWFLYVILHMESNASSFSPGRADQYLYSYYRKDIDSVVIDDQKALELIEALWLKLNQIVYLRNSHSAKYFAGFPIGFNIACGGQDEMGRDAANELSFLFLKAQSHILLPQPNLSARLFSDSDGEFVDECSRVIGLGSGMPQIFNDEGVIPALMNVGIQEKDARNYAIVGCVELTTHGNSLGWSDAAMFNLMKALELTLNNGVCLLSGRDMGLKLGTLADFNTFEDLENALAKQLDHYMDRMIACCEVVDRTHAEVLPSAFLSSVIDDCIGKGMDVTAGGAYYNLSGIQAIQVANLSDSLAVLKELVFDKKRISKEELLTALQNNWDGRESLRQTVLNKVPKFGNDVQWVDVLGNKWIEYFAEKLRSYTNIRGGVYHTGLYTVSAHVPMGQNVGASADGRRAMDPLADGGVSAMYGRDTNGPTALLNSVSRINSKLGSNGTLLNMKFLPDFFETNEGIQKFSALLRTFVDLKINHIQFNVLRKEDLIEAKKNPEKYSSLTVRVAGYTAYFTELAADLQDEIIARTSYGENL
ncbi:MAG: formate C-acetyltransferase/glycerol dehydratase family glycyl radical enzyme [Bacteroidetes bacterium]|nr:formate C-acetyltransferase/glycerol dehydratase family glycyl radical enzyme [Bacteroidota bacterium]